MRLTLRRWRANFEQLHFAGEVLDVDAYTGGFNLQIAFPQALRQGMRFARNKEEKSETICHCGGWAGSGKSTVAKMVAKRLGIIYVDTGAMYRTVALFCTEKGIAPCG